MNAKSLCCAFVGAIAALSLSAAAAQAAKIDYVLNFTGTGNYEDGQTVSPFSGVDFTVDVFGDTNTLFDGPQARSIQFNSADISAEGMTKPIELDSSIHFFFDSKANPGAAGFGSTSGGVTKVGFLFGSPSFAGYDAVSDIGPFPAKAIAFGDIYLSDTTFLTFSNVSDLTFQAITSVPEPATWAMMLVGLGGAGVMLRRASRKTVTA